jgi:hypothetical protein
MQLELGLTTEPAEIEVAINHADMFPEKFLHYLVENLHVYKAFEREALKIRESGRTHYSARTIIEVLRHNSALAEVGGNGWKLNDRWTPSLARLFDLMHPGPSLFEKRKVRV